MPTERKGSQWGPVYLDEFQSIEVRRLSNGARDLWVAVACRTRSAKNGPCSEQGYFASYEALARDLSRWSKSDAQLNPISVRTVKRAKGIGPFESTKNDRTGLPGPVATPIAPNQGNLSRRRKGCAFGICHPEGTELPKERTENDSRGDSLGCHLLKTQKIP